MELIYGLLAGGVAGMIGGYVLATHIHSIADAAVAKAASTLASSVGMSATLSPMPIAPAPAPVVAAAKPTV